MAGSDDPVHERQLDRANLLREIAAIQPDQNSTVDVEGKTAYLIVAHTLPKGRKYHPLYFPLDATLSDVRWEFGRVARRGVATFSMWQGAYRFKDREDG